MSKRGWYVHALAKNKQPESNVLKKLSNSSRLYANSHWAHLKLCWSREDSNIERDLTGLAYEAYTGLVVQNRDENPSTCKISIHNPHQKSADSRHDYIGVRE